MHFGLSFPLACQLSDVVAVAELAKEAELPGGMDVSYGTTLSSLELSRSPTHGSRLP